MMELDCFLLTIYVGYIGDENGNTFKTTGLGITWNYQGLCPHGSDGISLSFINDTIGYFGDEDGNIFKTNNSVLKILTSKVKSHLSR